MNQYLHEDKDNVGRGPCWSNLCRSRRTQGEVDWSLCHARRRRRAFGHAIDINGKKTQLRGLLDTGAVLSVIPIETCRRTGFDKEDLIDSRIRLSAANEGALRVLGRSSIVALNLGDPNLWMSLLVVENLEESDQFLLGRDFIRNFDVTIDLNNARFRIRNPERKYVIRSVNLIITNGCKAPIFLV